MAHLQWMAVVSLLESEAWPPPRRRRRRWQGAALVTTCLALAATAIALIG